MTTGTVAGALHGPGLTDVRMMTVAHSNFRRELKLSVPAVRAVSPGDTRRAAEIAEHVEMWIGFVHHHHTIEDELLWQKLTERVPEQLTPLIDLMESQHENVAALLEQCPPLVGAWRMTASDADGTRLADHLAVMVNALQEHLDAEETRVLPLMAIHIRPDEWEEFTERGMESIPKKLLLTGFGMMLYEGDPQALALEIAKFQAPMRPLLPFLARRAFRKYAKMRCTRSTGFGSDGRGTGRSSSCRDLGQTG
jgi:hemerythrin-like domain-containing protein